MSYPLRRALAVVALACACVPAPPPDSGGTGGTTGGTGGQSSSATGGVTPAGTGGGTPTGSGGARPPGTGGAAPAGTGGASGTGGSAGTPDAGAPDQSTAPDTGGGETPAAGIDAAPLTECPGGSIDRFQRWLAHANVGAGGRSSLLSMEGGRYVAKGQFPGGNWSEIVVLLGNTETAAIDLSKSKGFEISYSATAPLWIQMRGNVKLHGGDQHVVALPATGGMTTTKFFSFEPASWTFAPGLGKPTHALADVVKSASFFDIVGNTANTVKFSGLRFDGYVPACR